MYNKARPLRTSPTCCTCRFVFISFIASCENFTLYQEYIVLLTNFGILITWVIYDARMLLGELKFYFSIYNFPLVEIPPNFYKLEESCKN